MGQSECRDTLIPVCGNWLFYMTLKQREWDEKVGNGVWSPAFVTVVKSTSY